MPSFFSFVFSGLIESVSELLSKLMSSYVSLIRKGQRRSFRFRQREALSGVMQNFS